MPSSRAALSSSSAAPRCIPKRSPSPRALHNNEEVACAAYEGLSPCSHCMLGVYVYGQGVKELHH